jgi:hypothetical protein
VAVVVAGQFFDNFDALNGVKDFIVVGYFSVSHNVVGSEKDEELGGNGLNAPAPALQNASI